jgi:cysteine desulfurase
MGMNKDIAVSNGSSCNSSLIQPSHVLLALGLSNQEAMSSIRVSLGRGSEISDVDIFIDRINTFINL